MGSVIRFSVAVAVLAHCVLFLTGCPILFPPSGTVTLQPGSATIKNGETVQLTANSTNNKDSFRWTSSAPGTASVFEGIVTGVAPGSATIKATGTASGKFATAVITVEPLESEGEVSLEGELSIEGEPVVEGEEELGVTRTILLPGNVPLDMVWIPAGTFMIGSPEEEQGRWVNEGPQHQVTLSSGFWMGKYELTQAQWTAVMNNNPSWFQGGNASDANTDNRPVESVSWDGVTQMFIPALNAVTGQTFRLPTGSEWEYACRAGTRTRFYWGDDLLLEQIGNYAWYADNSGNETHDVGVKTSNIFGLYDMSGSVWEWCQDWSGDYPNGQVTDPAGPSTGTTREVRGNCWSAIAGDCRSAGRGSFDPSTTYSNIGFRLVSSELTLIVEGEAPVEGEGEVIVEGEGEPVQTQIISLPGGVPLDMVWVPAGTFTMGSPEGELGRDPSEGPQHQVTLSRGFWMGKYELTQAQWKSVMNGVNPSYFQGANAGNVNTDNRPVENVSWDDVTQTFLPALTGRMGLTFRLPTEAEWEYACRGGTTTRFYWGDDPSDTMIGDYAWWYQNADSVGEGYPHVVGGKLPNNFGLYDMLGNVSEWCQDWYEDYASGAVIDPTGPASGVFRMLRGGSCYAGSPSCRPARRSADTPDNRYYGYGFRLVSSE